MNQSFHADFGVNQKNKRGKQLLPHRNDDIVEGGVTVVLDSHPVLEEMREKHPQHFATLTRVHATFVDYHSGKYVL